MSEKNYNLSVVITLLTLGFLFILYGFDFFFLFLRVLSSVNWVMWSLMFVVANTSALSFFFPFLYLLKKKKLDVSLGKLAKLTYFYTFYEILGRNTLGFLSSQLKISKNGVRVVLEKTMFSDFLAILVILSVCVFFITDARAALFFRIVLLLELPIIVFVVLRGRKRVDFGCVFPSVFRYALEFPIALVIFSSFGLKFGLASILAFTACTSLLYYIPRVKLAGGLLDLFLIFMFVFLGYSPIFGFAVAFLFRLSSVCCFVTPNFIIGRLKAF